MRPGALTLSLLAAGLALQAPPAGCAAPDTSAKPPARMHLPANLRGQVSPEPPPPQAARPPAVRRAATPAPLPPAATASPDPGQCRTACAHAYYFCVPSPTAGECAAAWSQCVSGCNRPPQPTLAR